MFGCLSMLLVSIACGIACSFLLGSFFEGFLLALISVAALNMGLMKVSDWRNRAMIQRWAKERGLSITGLRLRAERMSPPQMPWWMDWSAYELLVTDDNGRTRQFYFFITGFIYCLFGASANVSTPEDYITIRFSGNEATPSLEDVMKLVENKTDEKTTDNTVH